ncbi:MAG: hypothetical protein QM713_14445 [Arachnia sp.]
MNTTTPTTTRNVSRFGRARFGGPSILLLAVSVILGALLSAAVGLLFATFGDDGRTWLAFTVMAVTSLPIAVVIFWALLVDLSTLKDRLERPEESIENVWYEKATSGAFHDLIFVFGLGTLALTIFHLDVQAWLVLTVLFLLAAGDVVARYLFLVRAGR